MGRSKRMGQCSVLGWGLGRPALGLLSAGVLLLTESSTAAAAPARPLPPPRLAQALTGGQGPTATAWPPRIRPAADTAPAWAPAAAPLVLRGVTVIDVARGRRLANQTVVIVGTRIRTLGPVAQIKVPRGARVVDGRGKYLIPGLWDMHVHPRDFVDIAFPLYLASGVTGVRDPGSGVPLAVLGQLKREIAAGTRIGPRMVVAGPLVHGVRGGKDTVEIDNAAGLDGNVWASTPEKVRRVVDSLQAAGADFIKTYWLSPEMYFAVAAEARRIGIPFGGHGPYDHTTGTGAVVSGGGLTLSDSGAQILDHFGWLIGDPCGDENADADSIAVNVAHCAAAGRHLRRNGTWIAQNWPTFWVGRVLVPALAYEEMRYAPRSLLDSSALQAREALQQAPGFTRPLPRSTAEWIAEIHCGDSLRRLQGRRLVSGLWLRHNEAFAQLPIVAGTDTGPQTITDGRGAPGSSLHRLLVGYVLGGMTPLAALQTATLNPARALRATDSLGTVAAGKVADLVLLDADPLADIWHTTSIRAVVANGRYFDRAALDRLRAQAEQLAAER